MYSLCCRIKGALAATIERKAPYSVIHPVLQPNGEVRIVHEVAQLVIEESSGRPLKLGGTTHDITEKKKAEEQLL